MSQIRVLVGTKKGAFILTSDGKREQWDVSGPLFASPDGGDHWTAIVRDLPAVVSVEVQTL